VRQLRLHLPDVPAQKPNTKYVDSSSSISRFRLARSLGWHVEGCAPMGPDINDLETIYRGRCHRMNRLTPTIVPKFKRSFRQHVRLFLRNNFKSLPVDVDTSIETWLASTSYPEWRKEQLRNCHDRDIYRNKSFIKREFYDVPKHARWINSRSDSFKQRTGPIFKLIEKEIFDSKYFIKHVPVAERSKFIHDRLYRPGASYVATDHSSFEAHISPEIMRICEMQLYSYMTRNLPERGIFLNLLKQGLLGKQNCSMNSKCRVRTTTYARMSGDMCTSLGNGFTNLMVMSYVAYLKGWDNIDGVVEGDDGIFRLDGPVPTSEEFASLGFTIKSEVFDDLGVAGFCQLYFAGQEFDNLVDPKKILLRSGWTMSSSMNGGDRIMKELTRAKALSMLCEAPINPVTSSMARWLLRMTRSSKSRVDESDEWYYHQCVRNVDRCLSKSMIGPSMHQREFVAHKFGLSVNAQLSIEKYFDNKTDLGPINQPDVVNFVSTKWSMWSWNRNVIQCKVGESWN